MLCAPAVIVMIGVTAYPVVYAVILSLQRYNLELPAGREVHRLQQLRRRPQLAVLVGRALKVTVIITIFSVGITLVLGMLLALLHAPDAVRPGHGPDRRRSSRTGS